MLNVMTIRSVMAEIRLAETVKCTGPYINKAKRCEIE